MNRKEIGELRRRFRQEKSAISRVYGCFVNSSKEVIADLDESLGMMPKEEAEKYLGFLKKALSGALGKNLMDIVFSTQQVVNGEEHKLLTALRASGLRDEEIRSVFYRKIIESLELEGNYLILLAYDAYDVPHRGKDGEVDADGSDEVFQYIVCAVCPLKEGKVELGYFPKDNEFHCVSGQTVAPPEVGFLFPAFDDRSANIYNALYYTRNPEELHQEFVDAVFRTEPLVSATAQKEGFRGVLVEALEEECDLEVVQGIHEQISGRIEEHKQSKEPEMLTMTGREISGILQDCGVSQERAETFLEKCEEEFGEDAQLNPANLIDPGRFELKTEQVAVSVAAESRHLVEERVINGRRYLLVPIEEGLELNGMPIRLKESQG